MAAKMIWAWGYNQTGQLGINSTNDKSSPVSIAQARSYKAIAIGGDEKAHALAIDAVTGMVWAWGNNDYGELGINTNTQTDVRTDENKSSPVSIVRAGSYSAVAAGREHSLAIDAATGMVWAWGQNAGYGALGINVDWAGDQSSPVSIARAGSYKAVAAGMDHSLALDATGMIWAWGKNDAGQLGNNDTATKFSPVSIARVGSYSAIASGANHNLAIDAATGMVWTWGLNENGGQLGNASMVNQSSPVSIVRAGSYSAIAGGAYFSLAIDAVTGMVWAWGLNERDALNLGGQLGINSVDNQSFPVAIARAGSYSAIAGGGQFSLAIDAATGRVWASGVNYYERYFNFGGQLGNDSTASQSSPVSIASTKKFSKIAAATYASLGLEKAGDISAFNQPTVTDGASVTSIVDPAGLVDAIQAAGTDTYFDTTAEVARVDVYYRHQDGRQQVRLPHKAPSFTTGASWTPTYTRDGTWAKSRIRAFDWEGAMVTLDGTNVPSGEDLTHGGGVMNLNT